MIAHFTEQLANLVTSNIGTGKTHVRMGIPENDNPLPHCSSAGSTFARLAFPLPIKTSPGIATTRDIMVTGEACVHCADIPCRAWPVKDEFWQKR